MYKKVTGFSIIVALAIVLTVAYSNRMKVLGIQNSRTNENIRGLIIPHHDLASEIIIRSIDEIAAENDYDKIFIIGPNHFFPDNPLVVSGRAIQNFPIDTEFVDELATLDTVFLNEDLLAQEHSMIVPIKYLHGAFPAADFVPLVISSHYSERDLKEVSNYLAQHAPEKSLWVLAIDFAHNVTLHEGLAHNEESITALKSFDYERILGFSDSHLDSPVGTTVFLKVLENLNATSWRTFESTHGSVIEGVPNLNGTSYVVGTFHDDRP